MREEIKKEITPTMTQQEVDENFAKTLELWEEIKAKSGKPHLLFLISKDAVVFMAEFEEIRKLVLGYLAQICFKLQVSDNLNTYGVMSRFEDMEGWPPMDGSFGILIKHMDSFEFDFQHDCDIKKTKISEMPPLPKGNF